MKKHIVIVLLIWIVACGAACAGKGPGGTGTSGTGGAATTATSDASSGGSGSSSTGPAPVPFLFGDSTCRGTWHEIAPGSNEYGAISAVLAIPPTYPGTFTAIKFPLVANVPLRFCDADKQHTKMVAWIGKVDGSTVHPDAARTRIVDIDPANLTWVKAPDGSDLAEPTIAIDPPLTADDGEALWGGPSLTDDGDGYICTRYCLAADGSSKMDPSSWWSGLNAAGKVDPCPDVGCALVPLWKSVPNGSDIQDMRNPAEVTGSSPPAP